MIRDNIQITNRDSLLSCHVDIQRISSYRHRILTRKYMWCGPMNLPYRMPTNTISCPETDDFETTIPKFHIPFHPSDLQISFEPDPIKAAKTVTTSLPKIYNSWLETWPGQLQHALAEFNISNLRSKEYAYGAYLYHKSSHGNVRLANDDKVNAGYVVNKMNLYLEKILSRMPPYPAICVSISMVSIITDITRIACAGPTGSGPDSLKQRIYQPGIDLGIESNYTDSEQLNYNIDCEL